MCPLTSIDLGKSTSTRPLGGSYSILKVSNAAPSHTLASTDHLIGLRDTLSLPQSLTTHKDATIRTSDSLITTHPGCRASLAKSTNTTSYLDGRPYKISGCCTSTNDTRSSNPVGGLRNTLPIGHASTIRRTLTTRNGLHSTLRTHQAVEKDPTSHFDEVQSTLPVCQPSFITTTVSSGTLLGQQPTLPVSPVSIHHPAPDNMTYSTTPTCRSLPSTMPVPSGKLVGVDSILRPSTPTQKNSNNKWKPGIGKYITFCLIHTSNKF